MDDTDRLWDRAIVARIAAGDETALAAAYDRYASLSFGIACQLVPRQHADDICQEAFMQLWRSPDGFDAERGSLRTYIAVITRRRAIDRLRKEGRRMANEERSARLGDEPVVADVGDAATRSLEAERVRSALQVLPAEQRQAIELAYFDGLTFREVAVATGVAEGTAKSRLRLALIKLGSTLGSEMEMEQA